MENGQQNGGNGYFLPLMILILLQGKSGQMYSTRLEIKIIPMYGF